MTKKYLIVPLLLLALGMTAQKKCPLKDILFYGGLEVSTPILCDSINVKNEPFSWQAMLKTQLNEPMNKSAYKRIQVRDDSTFQQSKPSKGYELSLWKFFVNPENFLPLKLELKSTNAFEVYVDGVKNTEKKTRESSWEKAGTASIELKADPRQYQITIKMLAASTDSCDSYLSVSAKTEKKDSVVDNILSASERRRLWTPDYLSGKRISSVSISPNGRYALIDYSLIFKDGSRNNVSELVYLISGEVMWSMDTNNKRMRWMPKTNALYYTEKGLEGLELHVLDPVSQQHDILAKNLPEADFNWSPKENFLICSVAESAPEDKGQLHRLINPEDRQPGFRSRSSLFLYELKTGLYKRLTYGKESTWLYDISADEKQLLFGNRISFVPEAPFSQSNLYLLNLENMKLDTIWKNDKYANDASFSPDGTKLLIKGSADCFEGIGLNLGNRKLANPYDIQAYIMDLTTKKVEPITKNFNPSIQQSIWNKKDGLIYFKAEDKDYVRLYSYDPTSKQMDTLKITPEVVSQFDLASDAKTMVYFGSSVNYTSKVYVLDFKKKRTEQVVADPGADRLSSIDTGKVEDWNFLSAAGDSIYGRFYLPPHFDASKKYPVLVYYYGGTSPTSRGFEGNYPLTLYAAMGYVVYTLQPSGTTGFGQEFAARHVNAWGDLTADEIIEGTKRFCRTHHYTDSTKIGCFGASYGGFMTMYLQTKTDLFKAAVSHAGISNIASYWGEGYWGYTYSTGASTGSYPWNNPQLYTDHSPLFHADKIHTPLLLLQGGEDTNVPIGEAIQMYTALKMLGKTVEFIKVDGENHSIRDFQRKLEWQRSILAWFAKYLKEDDRWWNELYKPGALDN